MLGSTELFTKIGRHLNIGAGQVVWQDIVRTDMSIRKRQFHKNAVIVEACERGKKGTDRLHLMGLVRLPLDPQWFADVYPFWFLRYLMVVSTHTSANYLPFWRRPSKSVCPMPMFISLVMAGTRHRRRPPNICSSCWSL